MTEPPRLPKRMPVDTVIQCTMDMEVAPVLATLDPADADTPQRIEVGHEGGAIRSFTLGALIGYRVLVAVSGIGLANSAVATARTLTLVGAPTVIVAGTTRGFAQDIEIGQAAAGTLMIYGATDATAFRHTMGQIPQMSVDYRSSDKTAARVRALTDFFDAPVWIRRVVSVDSFITAPIADPVRAKFPGAIGTDIETCTVAQIVWPCDVNWVGLWAVSDLCGSSVDQDLHMDSEAAAKISACAVTAYLTPARPSDHTQVDARTMHILSIPPVLQHQEAPSMTRIPMVCAGNICRFTIAHQVLAEAVEMMGLDAQTHVDSAGGFDEERGNPIDWRVARALRENGHDVPDHYTRQTGLYEFGEWDLIPAMTGHHLAALNRLRDRTGLCGQDRSDLRLSRDSSPQARPGDMDLPDPWYGDCPGLVETLEIIGRATPVMLEHLRGPRRA